MDGKLVRFVLISSVGMALSASSAYGQSVAADTRPASAKLAAVTVNVVNVPLATVVESIARQAGLRPFYDERIFDGTALVSIHVRDVPADEALAMALAGSGLKARIAAMRVSIVKEGAAVAVVQGGIIGKIVDAKTRRPVRGATIVMSDQAKSVTSGDDGTFRVTAVTSGTHTIRVRCLGYQRTSVTVTVVEGQIASLDIALEPSVNALDQVVVTGTIVATAQREIPNAMTVITAKDIEQRGITKIDQLFRGDVPGVFAANSGGGTPLDEVTMFSRGATALSTSSAGTASFLVGDGSVASFTNPMKTYVDGVELADPRYLSQIDPKSIERIEIVTGPQASTIYGSNAINGVMQVFTKRGTSTKPQLTATLLSGWVQNDFHPTWTPQHDDAVQVNGVEGHWAYNVGGSWTYMGPWTPGKQTSRVSGVGGARMQHGPVTADGSLRLATTQTRQKGVDAQTITAFLEQGWYAPVYSNGITAPTIKTLLGQTLGLSLGLAPFTWWSHELVLGADRSASESRGIGRKPARASDTLLILTQSSVDRRSVRYASTVQVPLAAAVRAVVTVGADAWQSLGTSLNVSAATLTGTLTPSGTPTVTRQPSHNTGGFLQTQVRLWDQLFVTYGLRAEWNPTYGDEAQPNWAPRYGASYARDVETPWGAVTAKVRVSYGRSTRPPAAGIKAAQNVATVYAASTANTYIIPYYGNYDYVTANPELGPEHQQGGEGGVELYLGHRASLVVTRYNQTVEDLIAQPRIDSVRSKDPTNKPTLFFTSCDAAGYCYYSQYQNVNVGTIRNQGWELQGTVVAGPLTTRATYSWTKSRTIGVNPRYRAFFTPASNPQYQPGASFKFLPEHTWSGSVTYARARTMIAVNLSGTGMLTNFGNERYLSSINPQIRLTADRVRLNTGSLTMSNAGYVMADLNASRRFSSHVEGIVQVQNVGDMYRNDVYAVYATLGRQTKLGLRLRL